MNWVHSLYLLERAKSACRSQIYRAPGGEVGPDCCSNRHVALPHHLGRDKSGPYKSRLLLKICAIFSVIILLTLLLPGHQHAYADGGAPNLAYVAGASKGVSVIDIAQQKVTNTFSLTGDPHMVYLSLDGRFLYVAQPMSGRVTLLAAKTGQTV